MDPQRDDSAEGNKDPRQPQEEATRTPDNSSNTNAAQQNPSSDLRRAGSDSVLPHYWAPQPVHPPVTLSPPNQLNPSMFQRRDVPVYTPLSAAQLYPTGGAAREPNHGFSGGSFQATGAAVAVGGGMDDVSAVSGPNLSGPNRIIPKRRYRKSQSKDGANSSASSAKSSGVQKSKASSSKRGKPATEDANAYIDRITGDLAFALANLQSAQATIAGIQADIARRDAERALAASAATTEDSAADREF
ncbi:hypothetical protein OCU04_004771 [Sclerotinia nivalis]|uniref:Uncharacterized protein n=1 Tax=Sclerotinia nivalis TaxID=352851 RepID=A0A9X0AR76_9HELO|nr:hypothetical protein OCU04_004771 [Sclerotinia nivalis]